MGRDLGILKSIVRRVRCRSLVAASSKPVNRQTCFSLLFWLPPFLFRDNNERVSKEKRFFEGRGSLKAKLFREQSFLESKAFCPPSSHVEFIRRRFHLRVYLYLFHSPSTSPRHTDELFKPCGHIQWHGMYGDVALLGVKDIHAYTGNVCVYVSADTFSCSGWTRHVYPRQPYPGQLYLHLHAWTSVCIHNLDRQPGYALRRVYGACSGLFTVLGMREFFPSGENENDLPKASKGVLHTLVHEKYSCWLTEPLYKKISWEFYERTIGKKKITKKTKMKRQQSGLAGFVVEPVRTYFSPIRTIHVFHRS